MCSVLLEPYCLVGREIASGVGSVAGNAASTATSDALSGIANAVESGVAFVVSNSIDLWIRIPSPDLVGEPAVARIQQWMLPLSAAVAVLGLITAGARMALTRKANPLIDVGSGLFIIAATSAVGVLLPTLLLRAGDAWSNWVLSASTGGQFAARLTGVLSVGGPQAAAAVVVVLGIIGILISAIQAVLMLFRQGALVILAGVLPLAAAGTLSQATRPWFRKVTSWMLALICYKPAAAAVYATTFTLIGTGRNLSTVFMGYAMVVMSLLALPVLLRFFTWTTGTIGHAASGGFLQAALSGAAAVGALRGSGSGVWQPSRAGSHDLLQVRPADVVPVRGGTGGERTCRRSHGSRPHRRCCWRCRRGRHGLIRHRSGGRRRRRPGRAGRYRACRRGIGRA